MTRIAFFNSQSGVGRTTLVYHLAHLWVELGLRVLLVDLDPQSNLTAMCLTEEQLEALWRPKALDRETLLGSLQPILSGSEDTSSPHLELLRPELALVPGDLGLSRFEEHLSQAWHRALDRDQGALRTLSALYRLVNRASAEHQAHLTLLDVGPNLGAINRAALLGADHIITPLAPDLFSAQGLRILGPTLTDWRQGWSDRIARCPTPGLELPAGRLSPAGYLIMQAGHRLSRPLTSYPRWIQALPSTYRQELLGHNVDELDTAQDPYCLGVIRHHQSLMPLALDARKPMFMLKPADGAVGALSAAVLRCRQEFKAVATTIVQRVAPAPAPNT